MDIQTFDFETAAVRTLHDDGEVFFVAKDVCELLGYVWNGAAAVKNVPAEWKGVRSVLTPSGNQEMTVLHEQGLYFFLARSDKPKAVPFQKWIAGEVIPSIRKTGAYVVPAAEQSDDQLIVVGYQAAIRKIELLQKKVAEDRPKVEFYDAVAESHDAIELGAAAKVLNNGIGRNRLFETLRERKILMENNQPYQRYIDEGWFRVVEQKFTKPDGSTHIHIKPLVYQKGLNGIRRIITAETAR